MRHILSFNLGDNSSRTVLLKEEWKGNESDPRGMELMKMREFFFFISFFQSIVKQMNF